ncbi:MAG: hypothetical protein ABI557_01445 [Aureliella sp.]
MVRSIESFTISRHSLGKSAHRPLHREWGHQHGHEHDENFEFVATHGFADISAHIGYMIVVFTLTFVAAVLSWRLYEKYFLKLSRLFSVR